MQFAFLATIGSERVKQPHPKVIFPVILFLLFPSVDAQSLVPRSCPICFVSRVLMLTKSLVPGESSLLSQENLNCASSFPSKQFYSAIRRFQIIVVVPCKRTDIPQSQVFNRRLKLSAAVTETRNQPTTQNT